MIDFKPDRFAEMPDPDEMNAETAREWMAEIQEAIAALDKKEPRNMNSEAYEEWADRHEELEDLLDDLLDRLEELA